MKLNYAAPLLLLLISCSGINPKSTVKDLHTESLIVRKVSDHVYVHTSYLSTEDFGNVPCNGIIVTDQNEAVVFDTPVDAQASLDLIEWIEESLGAEIRAVVPTHFHADCLGGLAAFHQKNITSFAHEITISLASQNKATLPQIGFDEELDLRAGEQVIRVEYPGAGHTSDNIVAYVPKDQLLFGGCLIKEIGAGKGNLEDADVEAWSQTVTGIKTRFPNVKLVIPGHGQEGGVELLDYTISLFENP